MRIRNLLITVAGRFPHFDELIPIEKQREGILDMTGVGAPYSYGSDCFHLVLSLTADASVSNAGFDQALRLMALRCARLIARTEKHHAAPECHRVALTAADASLPKVVLIYQVQSQVRCALDISLWRRNLTDAADIRPSGGIFRRRAGQRQL